MRFPITSRINTTEDHDRAIPADPSGSPAMAGYSNDVPPIYRLWLPASVLIIAAAVGYSANFLAVNAHDSILRKLANAFNSEIGFIEIATALVLAVAIFHGLRSLGPARAFDLRLLFPWIAINLLGATYFLGEEISWGQHIFEWSSGEWFSEHNDQGETNLHNISSWLDQKPRILLFIWCVGGGLLVPLWYRLRKLHRSTVGWPYWFWPTKSVLFVSILIAVIRIPDDVLDWLDVDVSNSIRLYFQTFNATEMQEFLFACFILIYMYSLRTRTGNSARSGQPS